MKFFRWLYRLLVVVVVVILGVMNVRLYIPAAAQYGAKTIPADAVAQLRFLRETLDAGAAEEMQNFFPEGYFFSYVLYGASWVQVGLRAEDVLREEALREARYALDRLDTPAGRAPFSPQLNPPYGVFYVGWTNWLRGSILLLDPTADHSRFESESAALAQAFDESDTPFLSAYPGQTWPVDSTVAIASLSLHDHLLTPRYGDTISRWLENAKQRLDPTTGLLPHRVDPRTGHGLETARGSSQSMIVRFLIDIDPEWAAEQYQTFRGEFVDFFGTVPGIREHPQGINRGGDVDSGPLINGLSASATVVTMGTAFLYSDRELGETWVHVGEAVGSPIWWDDTKRYNLGLLPIGDSFLVWSQTALPLTTAPLSLTYPSRVNPSWRVPLHFLSLGLVVLLLIPEWIRRRKKSEN